MEFNLIYSQGRVGDKTPGTLKGASLTAKAIEEKYGLKGIAVGEYFPAINDDWTASLPQAKNTLDGVRAEIKKSILDNSITVLASNTCSVSLATIPTVVEHYPDVVILWFDAHGDFNIPQTSESGYLGGMVVAAICGLWDSGHGAGVRPEKLTLVGAHDIDAAEGDLIRDAGIGIIPPRQVTPTTVLDVIGESKVWIHVDWDVLEPGAIPADYKIEGGLTLQQIQEVFRAIPPEKVLGLEFAEFQAVEDHDINQTAIKNILETFDTLFNQKIKTPQLDNQLNS